MSRIGRLPIVVPSDVSVIINESRVTVKGPKGEMSQVSRRICGKLENTN
jgi:large subunit ribosomal protein L6